MGWLAWVEASPSAALLRGSGDLYMVVNAAHILGIGLLIGAILPLDLRLTGVTRRAPLPVIAPFLSRAAAVGLMLAILTGLALWSVKPADYLGNRASQAKPAWLVLAGANILAQHAGAGWQETIATGQPPRRTRLHAAVSLMLWLSILLAGRWTGFL